MAAPRSASSIDRDGKSLWAFDRCETADILRRLQPGPDLQVRYRAARWWRISAPACSPSPHGLYVDRDGNIWVTDVQRQGRQGPHRHQVQPGRQGADDARQARRRRRTTPGSVQRALRVAGRAERRYLRRRRPWRRHQCPDREVHQGRQVHQGLGQARAPARASSTRPTCWRWIPPAGCSSPTAATTASRSSTRTASSSTEWKQFGRPSGVFINKNDIIYVADSQSTDKTNPGFKQGIRVGSVKDGKVDAYIPETKELGALEGVAADDAGNIYARLHQHHELPPVREEIDRAGRNPGKDRRRGLALSPLFFCEMDRALSPTAAIGVTSALGCRAIGMCRDPDRRNERQQRQRQASP